MNTAKSIKALIREDTKKNADKCFVTLFKHCKII